MKVLVLGANGMIGHAMIRVLNENENWEVFGTVRAEAVKRFFSPKIAGRLITEVDVENHDTLVKVFGQVRPDVVINCIGLTKHVMGADDPLLAIPINSLLPHRLAGLCGPAGARLIQVSTDCVFSGNKGDYTEDDPADATDIYGKSKSLGEVYYPNTITLRTSTIGHELQSAYGLLNWFLSQRDRCQGFTRAIFSGLPSVVFAQLIRDIVIPRPALVGLYHVGGRPIAKYDLLRLIAEVYNKSIEIVPDDQLRIDRSLSTDRFRAATGYVAPDWPELIELMHSYQ
ncbi:MAG: NAD(P)-dependent oxidoreductase [Gammaproteobacteria bacterium RBG_16_51_14]|nr:MAG: NAD(P)-dependent oxidoreductase [Gammaproteobacteria bacterium RBG_16_51_14]